MSGTFEFKTVRGETDDEAKRRGAATWVITATVDGKCTGLVMVLRRRLSDGNLSHRVREMHGKRKAVSERIAYFDGATERYGFGAVLRDAQSDFRAAYRARALPERAASKVSEP